MVGHSDLVVTAVPDPPSSVLPSAAFTLAPTVANQGTDPAAASTTSFFLVNTSTGAKKNLKGGQAVPALDPGTSASPVAALSLFSDTLPGTYFVQACADGPKGVSEDVENEQLSQRRGNHDRAAGAEPRGQLAHEPARHGLDRREVQHHELGAEHRLGRRGGQRHEVLPGLEPGR